MLRTTWALICALALAVHALAPHPARAQAAVDERFRVYYARYQGERILGPPISGLVEVAGVPAQYFEKARLEDHRAEFGDSTWGFMFGLLTVELMQRAPQLRVSETPVTYGQLAARHGADARVAPPVGFRGGVQAVQGGVFVPYDSRLQPASGYVVPPFFWSYMNRADLFPNGWLHAFGLPITSAFQTTAVKGGQQRTITMQAFERTVLTYDPLNPAAWQVERANIGRDALQTPSQPQPSPAITVPAAGETVALPLHIEARVGQPGAQVTAVLRWADGTTLSGPIAVLADPDEPGAPGWVVGSLDWLNESQPPIPATPEATLELRDAAGRVLASQPVRALSYGMPGTRGVDLYFLLGEELTAQRRLVAETPAIGTAALRELLWGPGPRNFAGFTTAIPTPQEVLNYPGREPSWGPRVRLLSLVIENGVATANFSPELRAYGGGSARVQQIRAQITRTLTQFPTVREVRIAIDGQMQGVLEP